MKNGIQKVVLAYSGGLDTSIILKWLQDEYNCEVIVYTANIGQKSNFNAIRQSALDLGIKDKNVLIPDLREEFAQDYIYPMLRANTVYEGEYLLGTSIARPIIAKKQIEIAKSLKADAVAHGATGKGNDQVRFELSYMSLWPDVKIIAPWREWSLNSRKKLSEYAKKYSIKINTECKELYSIDENIFHISYEGLELEYPEIKPSKDMWQWTKSISKSADEPDIVEIEYQNGDAKLLNGEKLTPLGMIEKLNKLGSKHGVGRVDLIENRFVGIKSRGCYETPGGTILLKAHRAAESIALDKEVSHLKDELMPKYAKIIYNGFWFSPEREVLQALIDASQKEVDAKITIKLYKGNVIIVGRESKRTLFDKDLSTFEEDAIYNQKDAQGFINLNGLRLTLRKKRKWYSQYSE